ncbi:MAG TPA: DUF3618 domain-containing protein [Allosphingosinicella sp.]|nr:DUF3618 domain-containing protein [Allosphingosinicella sp.]
MNAAEIETAKREADAARRRFDSTSAALQQRLHPKSLATEAWDGVKEMSSDLAEGALGAVKQRPGAVSLALGAAVLFLARKPLRRAVGHAFGREEDQEDDGRIVTRIDTISENYHAEAPSMDLPPVRGAKDDGHQDGNDGNGNRKRRQSRKAAQPRRRSL